MKRINLMGKIFGIALVLVMIGSILGIIENYMTKDDVFVF